MRVAINEGYCLAESFVVINGLSHKLIIKIKIYFCMVIKDAPNNLSKNKIFFSYIVFQNPKRERQKLIVENYQLLT